MQRGDEHQPVGILSELLAHFQNGITLKYATHFLANLNLAVTLKPARALHTNGLFWIQFWPDRLKQ
jgi:hypothetical protein